MGLAGSDSSAASGAQSTLGAHGRSSLATRTRRRHGCGQVFAKSTVVDPDELCRITAREMLALTPVVEWHACLDAYADGLDAAESRLVGGNGYARPAASHDPAAPSSLPVSTPPTPRDSSAWKPCSGLKRVLRKDNAKLRDQIALLLGERRAAPPAGASRSTESEGWPWAQQVEDALARLRPSPPPPEPAASIPVRHDPIRQPGPHRTDQRRRLRNTQKTGRNLSCSLFRRSFPLTRLRLKESTT